jgi:rhodanese-related sulfurtransferase
VQILLDNGLQNVIEMDGGLTAWEKKGYPVTSATTVP